MTLRQTHAVVLELAIFHYKQVNAIKCYIGACLRNKENETTAAQFNSKLKTNRIPVFIPHKTTLSFTHHPAIKRSLALVEGDRKRGWRRCTSSRDEGTLEKTTSGLRSGLRPESD